MVMEAAVCAAATAPELLPDWEDPALVSGLAPHDVPQRIARARAPARVLLASRAPVLTWLARVRALHWLDAHRYPTHPTTLALFSEYCALRRAPLQLLVHVTPRQVRDSRRPHIRIEYDRFVSLLRARPAPPEGAGASASTSALLELYTAEYFAQEKRPSLATHFRLLTHFAACAQHLPAPS